MNHVRRRSSATLAVALVAAPDTTPDLGPSGVFPGKMKAAYGFNAITNHGAGKIIGIVDAYDDPNVEPDLGTFNTQFGLLACTTANGCFKSWSVDSFFQAPHVTFVAASGDGGHTTLTSGQGYPAASPYGVAVGGTSLTINSTTGAWMSETAWSDSGGGESAYETEPAYQMGVQTSGKRGVPDVAYDGNPGTGIPSYSSWACSGCLTGWGQWGATSIGTPRWAALFAIVKPERHAAGKAKLTQPRTAVPGYNFVTGLGSPQANLLIPALVAAP